MLKLHDRYFIHSLIEKISFLDRPEPLSNDEDNIDSIITNKLSDFFLQPLLTYLQTMLCI